jgi:O-antigen/teichoic acid export membrane protein
VFALPLVAFAASQYGMRSVDIIVLRAYRPASDVGVYALAYQGYTMLQTLATTITIVLIPLFVSLGEANRSQLILRYFERLVPQSALIVAALGGLLAPAVTVALPLVLGSHFADAARPLALLVAALALLFMASMLAPILMLHERTRAISVVNVAALALNVIGDVLLVGWLGLGIMGPAIATVGALAVIMAGYLAVARRVLATEASLSPALALPLLGGVLPSVLLPAASGVPLGLLGAAGLTALVVWRSSLFAAEDAELVEKLDLPTPVRQRAVRVIRWLAR